MLDLSRIREQEKGLLQKMAKLESHIADLQKKAKEAARKDDARRKIIFGGALLAAIEAGAIPVEIGRKLVTKYVSEKDRKMFDGSAFGIDPETAVSTMPDGNPRE